MKIRLGKFILVVLNRLLFTVLLKYIKCYLILMTFPFGRLFLPQAIIITILLNFIKKEHYADDLFSFYEEIQQRSGNDRFLDSYDVCSLFTSILLPGTNEIAVRLIFENSSQPKITKHELKKLFNFATSGTRFIFK